MGCWRRTTIRPSCGAGVTCVKPQAALYLFPRLDPEVYPIEDDLQFFLETPAPRGLSAGRPFAISRRSRSEHHELTARRAVVAYIGSPLPELTLSPSPCTLK